MVWVLLGLCMSSPAAAESGTGCNQAFGQATFPGDSRVVALTVGGTAVKVLLPSDYATSSLRYPALYLLHGAQGNEDSWLNYSDILAFTRAFVGRRAALVVMAATDELTGEDVDWRNDKRLYESLIVDQLIPYVDAHFRTLADRGHRAVAGYSGGGFSSTHLAVRHPDLFVTAASFSGLVDLTFHSPATEDAFYGATLADSNCQGGQPGDESIFGDPVTEDIWWHNANPADLASNLRGMFVYSASGNGVPCNGQDVASLIYPITAGEPAAYQEAQSFDSALARSRVSHLTDLYGCGIHWWPYWQRDLHVYWPIMLSAFGTPPPLSFDYRSADPVIRVWDWSFSADPRRAPEFLDITDASSQGLTLTGSGRETVTTASYFPPGSTISTQGATGSDARADSQGRITFTADLGPPHSEQQYTPAQALNPQPFITRTVRFTATTHQPAAAPASSCVPAPQLPRPSVKSGATIRVRRGAIVYVGLAEPEKYLSPSYPKGFPWRAPTSSSPRILAPVRLCKQTGASTLPVSLSAFRARSRGKATLSAPLKSRWRSHRTGLQPYRSTVIVTRP